ncbi:DUF362 domain-containing protein [Candidatus Magnetobacterium casense]|uniref:DUF362 domain-containing protein n=1 Tax=Candidatus Magnetobacterium casense TaxID=1455061 RepID=A0ABS6RTN1_9BACT|nr:DUF362 domain-containing protein [Candidatus Magnetobacterium casensis]MBV6339977.1 DUF362 domain-containing protein [Candidatus Magnetobacterium casensis]
MPSKNDKTEPVLSRREFLSRAGVTGAIAMTVGVLGAIAYSDRPMRRSQETTYTFKNYRVEPSALYPTMVIAHGKDTRKMVQAAFDKLGGLSRFIKPGERVLIKPNVGWDRQPELAANTSPDVVAAVVALCLQGRASEVWVTDVSINDPYRSFARSGVEAAVLKSGGKVKFTTGDDFLQTDLKGEVLNIWPVCRYFHQVDKLINIPVLKHHSLSKCTLAMKNWYGVLGGSRNRLHQEINLSIADLASAIRPTLTIMDATRVLKRNGPTGGNISDVEVANTIIAGVDEVAIDAYSLRFLDLSVADVPFLSIAQARGVGTTDLKSLNTHELNTD